MTEENKYNSQYDDNKAQDKIYVSKQMNWKPWKGRYIEQVVREDVRSFVVTEKDSQVLYSTDGGNQKIQATLLTLGEDSLQVPVIYVSRINVKTGKVHCSGSQQMCLYPDVAEKLYNFIGKVKSIDFSNPDKFKLDEQSLEALETDIVNKSDSYMFFMRNPQEVPSLLVDLLNENEADFNINDIYKLLNIKKKEKDIQALENRLENMDNYQEDKGEDNWQDWFKLHKWIFGSCFVEILDRRTLTENYKVDYLVQTYSGFVDIIEIKDPNPLKKKVFSEKKSTYEGQTYIEYYPSQELTQAISQTLTYINELEKKINCSDFKEKTGGNILKPRGILLYGRSNKFNQKQQDALRILNSHYNNFEIITYDQLLERAKKILGFEEII